MFHTGEISCSPVPQRDLCELIQASGIIANKLHQNLQQLANTPAFGTKRDQVYSNRGTDFDYQDIHRMNCTTLVQK
jgi:hypothetical protein